MQCFSAGLGTRSGDVLPGGMPSRQRRRAPPKSSVVPPVRPALCTWVRNWERACAVRTLCPARTMPAIDWKGCRELRRLRRGKRQGWQHF